MARSIQRFSVPGSIRSLASRALKRRRGAVFRPLAPSRPTADLGHTNRLALRNSYALVLLCGSDIERSEWLNEHIREFASVDRDRPIVYVLVDGPDRHSGTPVTSFPSAARMDGHEPLAADLRNGAEPKRLAVIRIMAGVLDCDFDDLRQRWKGERILKRIIAATIATVAILSIIWLFTILATSYMVTKENNAVVKVSSGARNSVCQLYDQLGLASHRLQLAAGNHEQHAVATKLGESAARIWLQCAHDEERWGFVDDYETLYCPAAWAVIPPDLADYVRCPK